MVTPGHPHSGSHTLAPCIQGPQARGPPPTNETATPGALEQETDGHGRGYLTSMQIGKQFPSSTFWLISSIFFKIEMVENPGCGELLGGESRCGGLQTGLFF